MTLLLMRTGYCCRSRWVDDGATACQGVQACHQRAVQPDWKVYLDTCHSWRRRRGRLITIKLRNFFSFCLHSISILVHVFCDRLVRFSKVTVDLCSSLSQVTLLSALRYGSVNEGSHSFTCQLTHLSASGTSHTCVYTPVAEHYHYSSGTHFPSVCFQCFCLQCFDAVGWAAGRASGL